MKYSKTIPINEGSRTVWTDTTLTEAEVEVVESEIAAKNLQTIGQCMDSVQKLFGDFLDSTEQTHIAAVLFEKRGIHILTGLEQALYEKARKKWSENNGTKDV